MIFQLILPVLLTPTNYCFQDQVTTPSDRLLMVDQTFTKLDMVYSDFLWSPPDMVSVLILDSRKYGHHQINLYTEQNSDLLNIWMFMVSMFFAMAKIRRIGHDHQLPFFLFLFSALQAWHEAKTSYCMRNTPRTPNIFTYSGPPIKLPLEGPIKGAPDPPGPPAPYGGAKIFMGGLLLMDHSDPNRIKYFRKLFTQI